VMEAQGSVLTNKYAEGYPGKRWYGGCEQVDKVETIAIERAKKLFGAEHANVQPHSGSQANFAVYTAVLQPGDKLLGMNLSHGGAGEGHRFRDVPGRPGRAADARDRGEGRLLRRMPEAGIQDLLGASREERPGAGRRDDETRLQDRFRRHRQSPDVGRSAAEV